MKSSVAVNIMCERNLKDSSSDVERIGKDAEDWTQEGGYMDKRHPVFVDLEPPTGPICYPFGAERFQLGFMV